MVKYMNGTDLPGYLKKSFKMPYGNAEIWFEHLDGLYDYSELAISKLLEDYETFKRPSIPSLMAFNLDETTISDDLFHEIVKVLTTGEKQFRKIVFVGVSHSDRKRFMRALNNSTTVINYINDFEKAKEWLVS